MQHFVEHLSVYRMLLKVPLFWEALPDSSPSTASLIHLSPLYNLHTHVKGLGILSITFHCVLFGVISTSPLPSTVPGL